MEFIYNFSDFILEEKSKNDPIPEISQKKLAIILIGAPGVGKSTFIKNFIFPRNRNIKSFSTDDVSLLYTKDPNIYYPKSSQLNIDRIKLFMKTGQSFIYDTTGTHEENIIDIHNKAKEFEYTIIYIHLIAPIDMSLKQNINRERNADEDYIRLAYEKQFSNMIKYSSELKPAAYYIVQNRGGKYKFSKYKSGRIVKRRGHRY